MDKVFTYFLVAFFILCAAVITWGTHGDKRNRAYKLMSYAYTALLWICVISLTVLIVIYKGI